MATKDAWNTIVEMRNAGAMFKTIATALNQRNVKTSRGLNWTAQRVVAAHSNATRSKKMKTAKPVSSSLPPAEFVLGLVRQVHRSNQSTNMKQVLINALVTAYTN